MPNLYCVMKIVVFGLVQDKICLLIILRNGNLCYMESRMDYWKMNICKSLSSCRMLDESIWEESMACCVFLLLPMNWGWMMKKRRMSSFWISRREEKIWWEGWRMEKFRCRGIVVTSGCAFWWKATIFCVLVFFITHLTIVRKMLSRVTILNWIFLRLRRALILFGSVIPKKTVDGHQAGKFLHWSFCRPGTSPGGSLRWWLWCACWWFIGLLCRLCARRTTVSNGCWKSTNRLFMKKR